MQNKTLIRRPLPWLIAATVSLGMLSAGPGAVRADETPAQKPAVTATTAAALTDAAAAGNTDEVRRLLDAGMPVDARRPDNGWTALIAASREGRTDVAQLLIDRGADLNAASTTGYTPLMAAAQYGSTDLLRRLLLHGADPNKATPSGLTPLMLAAANKLGPKAEATDLDDVRLLLRGGADPDQRHRSGATALTIAVSRGARRIATYLRLMGTPISPTGGALAGAGAVSSQGNGRVTGIVYYRERVGLSPYALLQIRFLDASRNPVTVISQSVVPIGVHPIPLPFSISYDPNEPALRPLARFAVDARIIDGGLVRFRSDSPMPTLLPGFPDKNVRLQVQSTTPEQQAALAADAIAATDKAIETVGRTFQGNHVVGDAVTQYKASFLGNRLVRIVADTNQASYGTRTDRFYFGLTNDDRGLPALRAAMLNAHRLPRGSSPTSGGPQIAAPTYEHVVQKIIVDDAGTPLISSKKVGDEDQPIRDMDITAARNFARLLSVSAYQTVASALKAQKTTKSH